MKGLEKVLKYAAICLICLMCLIPFYVLLVLALNSPQRVFYEGNIFIPDFYWQNFLDAWRKSKIGTAMLNSAIITAGTLILTIITGGLAGYAIARHNTKYNKFVFGLLLSCMMIPGIINTVPLYTLMRKIHAVNTLWGMILVCSTLAMPSAVFIYATFIKALPRELDEAAALDGCTGFSAFWRVIFLQSRAKQNIPQALSVFFQQFGGGKWHLMAATATIAIIPVVIIFLIFQKQFIQGLSDGAVKG